MAITPAFKKWACGTALVALNGAFVADGIQAHKTAYGPEGQGDAVSHMYAKKIMEPILEQGAKRAGVAGIAAVSAAFYAFTLPGLPGIAGGEYLGKTLYKPQDKPQGSYKPQVP